MKILVGIAAAVALFAAGAVADQQKPLEWSRLGIIGGDRRGVEVLCDRTNHTLIYHVVNGYGEALAVVSTNNWIGPPCQ